MKVGDLVMSSFGNNGTVMCINNADGLFWAEVWWSNGKFTWEDMGCSMECGSIWVINESR